MAVKNLGRIKGLSAYEIWLQEGNEGTEEEFLNSLNGKDGEDGFSPTIEVTKEGKVTTVTITDVNGTKTATINDGEDGNGNGDGENESTDILLGETPYTAQKDISKIKLVADGECSYTVKSPTVGDMSTARAGSVSSKATLTKHDNYYELASNSNSAGFYDAYANFYFDNLVVGNQYTFVRDASGLDFGGLETHETFGHFNISDSDGNAIYNSQDKTEYPKLTHTFVAPTTTIKVTLFPSNLQYYEAGLTVGRFRDIYVNEGEVEIHSQVIDLSGTFTNKAVLPSISKGVTINSTPSCQVYEVEEILEEEVPKSRHAGKICVCFGDSITGNMLPPGDYCTIMAEETGMTVYNGGFGGCRMSTHPSEAYAPFSMNKLADSVATGDWSLQDAQVGNVSGHVDVQLGNLKIVDWSKVDFITINYGTNDIASNVVLDNEENKKDTLTLLGALRYSIEKILTAYPHIKILLLTPIYRYWNAEDKDSDEKTFNDMAFTDYVDGIIDVAEEYKIPVVDMYRTLGFNKITRSYYFPSTDGTHPNTLGLKLMGQKISGKLLSEY